MFKLRRDGGQVVRDAETDANLSDERDATVMDARTEDATPRDIGASRGQWLRAQLSVGGNL